MTSPDQIDAALAEAVTIGGGPQSDLPLVVPVVAAAEAAAATGCR
jgi:hypothetical protein